MTNYQRLSERIEAENNEYGPENQKWSQFVHDHKDYIIKRCRSVTTTPEGMLKYKYRPTEYVVDNEIKANCTWIFLLINDIRDPAEFNENINKLKLFTQDVVTDLFRTFSGSENAS